MRVRVCACALARVCMCACMRVRLCMCAGVMRIARGQHARNNATRADALHKRGMHMTYAYAPTLRAYANALACACACALFLRIRHHAPCTLHRYMYMCISSALTHSHAIQTRGIQTRGTRHAIWDIGHAIDRHANTHLHVPVRRISCERPHEHAHE